MKLTVGLLLCLSIAITVNAQQAGSDTEIKELERKLDQAMRQVEQLTILIQSMREEIDRLKGERRNLTGSRAESVAPAPSSTGQTKLDNPLAEFTERIIEPELGHSEREGAITAKPEIFIQTRYAAAPIPSAASEFEPNLSLTRIEVRWAGKVADRVGARLEIQFHPAIDGSPEELVNDAFIEYYLNDHATIRVGQFIKPFGFEIQQSSAVRESPERGIFAGYFFPGQRDRGVMISGNLDFLGRSAIKNTHYFFGAFNGNRFFADTNRQLNYIIRLRKIFDRPRLAMGLSLQRGKQILPEGISGDNNENIIGVDFQYAIGRIGFRGEFAAGNTPSTLLSIEPEFAPAFRPGGHSSGGYFFATYRINSKDNLYARYDQFNGDPVTGRNVRAFNFGYFRKVGELSRLGFDYQFKNRPSFNNDAVNGRFHITWGIEF